MKQLTAKKMRREIDRVGARVIAAHTLGCRASVSKYGEGYLILVGDWLSEEAAESAIEHELLHIQLGHLDDDTKTEEEKEKEVQDILRLRRSAHGHTNLE